MTKSAAWWKGLVKYGLGFGALAYVVTKYWDQLKELFTRSPRYEFLLAAAALAVGATALQLYRWYLLVRALDLPFSGRGAIRLGLVGYYYNSFLPGSVGGDVVKAFFIARGQPDRKAAAVATVAADRLIGLFGLILYVAVVGGGCWLMGDEQIQRNEYLQKIIRICVVLAGATILGYILLGLLSDRQAMQWGRVLGRVPKAGASLADLWATARTYSLRPGTVLAAVALSAVVHTGFVLIFHFAVRVSPPENLALLGTLPEHFVIAPMGYIGQAFFPAPGGVGGGEALFGYLYEILRQPMLADSVDKVELTKQVVAVGVAGRLAMRLVEWTLGLIGYIAYLVMPEAPPSPNVAEEPVISPVPEGI